MNCEDFELYGSAYIDNMLSNEDKLKFENHINKCEFCNIKLQNLKIIVESINDIEEVELPINFSSSLKTKLENVKENQTKNITFSKRKMLNVIAVGIFIIITSISLISNSSIYKNKNNLASEIDKMSRNQEEITFDIASEESTESLEQLENEKAVQPRIMTIDNVDENQETSVEESIEETNDEDTYGITNEKNNDDSLENKDLKIQSTEKSYNKIINIFALLSLIVVASIFIYKRLKR